MECKPLPINAPRPPAKRVISLFALRLGIAVLTTMRDGYPEEDDFSWGAPVKIECDVAEVYCFIRNGAIEPEILLESLRHYAPLNWHIVRE